MQIWPAIYMIYNMSLCYNEWTSRHWNFGDIRKFTSGKEPDPYDNTQISRFNGDSTCEWKFNGDGIMNMIGRYPRLYLEKHYYNTENTMYYKKNTNNGKDSDGITFAVRSSFDGHLKNTAIDNHHWMNTQTYHGRIRHDGHVQICKEQIHGQKFSCYPRTKKYLYEDKRRLPKNQWFGMKFIVANICSDKVLLQLWVDKTSQAEEFEMGKAENWELLLEVVDQYGSFPSSDNDKVDLYNLDRNLPFLNPGMVFIRNSFIQSGESLYKYVSVREIELSKGIREKYLNQKNNLFLENNQNCCIEENDD